MKKEHRNLFILWGTLLVIVFGYFGVNWFVTRIKEQTLEINSLKTQIYERPVEQEKTTDGRIRLDLPKVVSEWRPRTVYIECNFTYDNGKIYQTSSGSGFISLMEGGKSVILTNRHVLRASPNEQTSAIYGPASCFATLPDNNMKYFFSPLDIKVRDDFDFGGLIFPSPDNFIKNLTKEFYKCSADLGDQIIILGYPSYGSGSKDVTVTEGIISGYDSPYYTTSAKMEHGNSGGVAISVKNNCYIGVPTGAITGEIESLGRILDFNKTLLPIK